MRSVFLRLIDFDDKPRSLRPLLTAGLASVGRFEVDPGAFAVIPNSPLAYWAQPAVLETFRRLPALESDRRHAAAGASTKDNLRFVRLWLEVASPATGVVGRTDGGHRWVPLAKGGSHARFFADLYLVLNWSNEGHEIKAFTGSWRAAKGWGDYWRAELHNAQYYGRPGVTWPSRSQAGFSARAMPAGAVFGDKGPAVFVAGDAAVSVSSHLALMNSRIFDYLVSLQMAFGSYETGVIQRTPVPLLTASTEEALSVLAIGAVRSMRVRETATETSHAFVAPAALRSGAVSLVEAASEWASVVADADATTRMLLSEVDELCFELYGILDEDRRAITEGFGVAESDEDADSDDDDEDGDVAEVDPGVLAAGLVSWCVGVGVGRFDVRLATGEREWPVEPGPFDALPVCSPGMLTGDDGLPLETPPVGYAVVVSPVLVTDPGHRLDITARVRSVFDVVFGTDADAWWGDVGEALGARGGEVEGWLAKGFFDHHLKTHSKSRRKAPILWPLGTKSGSYLVWLYAHRATADSLFQILHDIATPKITLEEQRLTQARQTAGPSPTASQRRDIDKQAAFVDELREFAEAIAALAPLWAPDLNDGIVIVLAPLWSLFAHHKPWAKELKTHWAKLVAGDYDWAQLAIHLWPERVIPKCATDRSLAIAHNLEEVFWVQDATNADKWHPRQTPTTPTDQLITHHHNPATTAALKATNP